MPAFDVGVVVASVHRSVFEKAGWPACLSCRFAHQPVSRCEVFVAPAAANHHQRKPCPVAASRPADCTPGSALLMFEYTESSSDSLACCTRSTALAAKNVWSPAVPQVPSKSNEGP